MTSHKNRNGYILPMVLIGAMLLAAVGFIGLLLEHDVDEGAEDSGSLDVGGEMPENEEFSTATFTAESTLEESLDQGDAAKTNAPGERPMPITNTVSTPQTAVVERPDQGPSTRSDDDLLCSDGFLGKEQTPGSPSVEMTDTYDLLNGHGTLLSETEGWVESGEAPGELPIPEIDDDEDMPVDESGIAMDDDQIEDLDPELERMNEDLGGYLNEYNPDVLEAGLDDEDLSGMAWDVSNSTTKDSDKDGNPEWIYELRVASGHRNDSIFNGTLSWVVGYEYEMQDPDSDGVANMQEWTRIRYSNYSVSGSLVAEGISYSHVIRNDTDGDGVVDRVEIAHLSYGWRATLFGGVKSFATGGELISLDGDSDGVFEDNEATAVFYYKHEVGDPLVPVRESVVLVHGEEDTRSWELSKLAFTRINNTQGVTQLEKGYIYSLKKEGQTTNLLVIGARDNKVTGRLQYIIFNGSETVTSSSTTYHVTAFAVDNRSIIGGKRSDAVAMDYEVTVSGNQRDETGFLAASRNDTRQSRADETFLLISVDRDLSSETLTYENITILAGKNVTTTGLNSTMGYAFREYKDRDADGTPEYLKEAWAVSLAADDDMDGTKEREGYAVHSVELFDSDDDGNPETNHTFSMMGWKSDPDSDGNIDVETGLMKDVKRWDNNSNGNVELHKEGWIGFEKKDTDSDGTIDTERYMGFWKEINDVNDDGTEVNESSGTWTHEA